MGWGNSSVAEPLLGMCEVLSSTPRTEENVWNYRIFEKLENLNTHAHTHANSIPKYFTFYVMIMVNVAHLRVRLFSTPNSKKPCSFKNHVNDLVFTSTC